MRKIFLNYFSKLKGPPRLRFHVCGLKRRHFYKLVACNQKDRKNGKHMEVLGSFAPKTQSGIKEIRLRFSRCKFWLGVGSSMSRPVAVTLARAGILPPPPPPYGRRAKGLFDELAMRRQEYNEMHLAEIAEFYSSGKLFENLPVQSTGEDGDQIQKMMRFHKLVR